MCDGRRNVSARPIVALTVVAAALVALVATAFGARVASAQSPTRTARAAGAAANDSTAWQRYAAAQAELKAVRRLSAERERARRSLVGGTVIHEGIVALRYDSAALGLRDRIVLGAAAREASAMISRVYGNDASTIIGTIALDASSLPLTSDSTRRELWVSVSTEQPITADDWRGIHMLVAPNLPAYIAMLAARTVESKVSPTLRRWSPLPSQSTSLITWHDAASALSTANSSVAQRCRAGSVDSCYAVLDYDSTTTPLQTFFAPSDYRLLAVRFSPSQRDSIRDPLARRCILNDDAPACSEFVQRLTLNSPVPQSVRASVISLALETGGPHALSRLVAARGSVREQLAAAAGIPADSLTRLWIRRVNETSSSVATASLATLAWTALLLLATYRRPTCN